MTSYRLNQLCMQWCSCVRLRTCTHTRTHACTHTRVVGVNYALLETRQPHQTAANKDVISLCCTLAPRTRCQCRALSCNVLFLSSSVGRCKDVSFQSTINSCRTIPVTEASPVIFKQDKLSSGQRAIRGERWSRGRAPDCQSRFSPNCRRFET